jgi:hypothetical protein
LKRAILRQANADYSFLQGVTATSVEAQGGSFVGSELQGALFTNAHLEGAIFERADMRWGAFDEAHFETAGFQGVDARAASFGLASFQGAVISQSDFRGAIFNSAELQGTIIYQTQLKGAYFDDAYVYRLTCVPPVPFYRCENLKFDFGWTVHRTIHTVKALRRPVGDKPIAPDEGAAYTEFANGISSAFPEKQQATVRDRLALLAPSARTNEDDDLDAQAWQTAPASDSVSGSVTDEVKVELLRSLVCDLKSGLSAAQGILRRRPSPQRVEPKTQITATDCPGVQFLDSREKRELGFLFDALSTGSNDR